MSEWAIDMSEWAIREFLFVIFLLRNKFKKK
jgi:hypothetical protein